MAKKVKSVLGRRLNLDPELVNAVLSPSQNKKKQTIRKPTSQSALGRGLELDQNLVNQVLGKGNDELLFAAGLIIQGAKSNQLYDLEGNLMYDINDFLAKIQKVKNLVQKNYNRTDNGHKVWISDRQIARAIFSSILDRKLGEKVNSGTLKILHDSKTNPPLNRVPTANLTSELINEAVRLTQNKIEALFIMFEEIEDIKAVIESLLELTPDAMGTRSP